MNPISGIPAYQAIHQLNSIQEAAGTTAAKQSTGVSSTKPVGGFGDLVSQLIGQTNADQIAADHAIADFVTGKTDNIQQVVMAMTNADLSFQFFMEVRNKVIESYNELQRMQF